MATSTFGKRPVVSFELVFEWPFIVLINSWTPFWLCFYSIDSTKWVTRFGIYNKISDNNPLPWWWFQMFFIFTPTWGNDQIWPSYGSVQPPTSCKVSQRFHHVVNSPGNRSLEKSSKKKSRRNMNRITQKVLRCFHSYLGWSLFPVSCDHPGFLYLDLFRN